MDPFQDLMNSSVLIMLNKVSVMPCGSCLVEQHCLTPEAGLPHGGHPNKAVALRQYSSAPACPVAASQPFEGFPRQTFNPSHKKWHGPSLL